MADGRSMAYEPQPAPAAPRGAWAWHPPLPLEGVPVFVWPPRPAAALQYLVSLAFLGSVIIPFGVIATLSWLYLQPALERCIEFRADWILQMYARNLGLMLLVAGGLHLYFYTFRRQGAERKFDPRGLDRNNPRFFARDQVWDNMLWSCASGVAFWTVYEAGFMWAYANDLLPFYLRVNEHPVWFAITLFMIPFWASLHFYFVHRLLHWKPLYRMAHALHHRNDNTGPWSGLSMHPIEHLLYLSSILIHAALATHPLHILFHMQWNTLGAAVTHTGFETATFRDRPLLFLGSFHHQLHHRYYDCNYGNPYMPWDRWLGSNHDGTAQATADLQRRRRERMRPRGGRT